MHELGVKAVAAEMSLSASLLYKWCQPKDHPDAAGADNPLDRLQKVIELTGNTSPVKWLCQQSNGFFTTNPIPDVSSDLPMINVTRRILKEFSELLDVVSESIENDGEITADEAGRIRKEWEELKVLTESFVVACEAGVYRNENGAQRKEPFMKEQIMRAGAVALLCIAVAGCDAPEKKPAERKQNIGDRYVRGTLGAGIRAQETIGLMAIHKAVDMYKSEHGKHPASLQELSQQGLLNPIPKAPPGKRFAYDAGTGTATMVDK
jgi:hypothetical protein